MANLLPPLQNFENVNILKSLIKTHTYLGILKGLNLNSPYKKIFNKILTTENQINLQQFNNDHINILKIFNTENIITHKFDKNNYLIENIFDYLKNPNYEATDLLIRLAISYLQIKRIYPNSNISNIANNTIIEQNISTLAQSHLSLFKYFNNHREEYSEAIKNAFKYNRIDEWILYFIQSLEKQAKASIETINNLTESIKIFQKETKKSLEEKYRKEIALHFFHHPYTNIELASKDLNLAKNTTIKYLNKISATELLSKKRIGKTDYYINNLIQFNNNYYL